MFGLTSYKEYLRLVERHDVCQQDSDVCRIILTPDCDYSPVCPCYPYGLTEEDAGDTCFFRGVSQCDASYTLKEREWCNSGDRSFASAFRIVKDLLDF